MNGQADEMSQQRMEVDEENDEEFEDEEQFMVLDVGRSLLQAGQTLEIMNIDSKKPVVKLPNSFVYECTYEESLGTYLLFKVCFDPQTKQRKAQFVQKVEPLLKVCAELDSSYFKQEQK
eukprot:TRINITY_DN33575_c1_g1_i1.p4 TRINITY_DN33575_c1_g1~~TRINITY_DN33575_c1_g1_i1.p4  ORF type:complete len:119 (+),score=26.80 TRINITY_DN33575_c1_g1_i1:175-531(+)